MATTVDKAKLIKQVKKNRKQHRALFLEAVEGYKKKAGQRLLELIDQIEKGKDLSFHWTLPVPVDYTASYDEALARLDWEVGEQVSLEDDEFRQLVLNKWGWERLFLENTVGYTSMA